ncbi:hypothetical protein [Brevundimonas sp.]|uniref:hypothetical protein n=1 Tax=Brevundimonas sp. TaxID=1871086 RepID=UPI002EDAD026
MNTPARFDETRLPVIDYARHPAYQVREGRIRALGRFAQGASVAFLRWLVDLEHLPKPPSGADKRRWLIRNAPRLGLGALRHNLARLTRSARAPQTETGREVAAALDRDGVHAFRLTAAEKSELDALTRPWFEDLRRRLARGFDHFDDNRLWIDRRTSPEIYAWFHEVLDRAGVLAASSARLGRPVTVAHLIPQLNTPETDFWTGQFGDVGEPDPACNYCHVDTAWGITKMIVYVGEVRETTGPFSYVRGSHRARDGFWGRLIRKANDYSGLSSTRPAARRLFAALPARLQRKAAFGPDLRDEHPLAPALLAAEARFTTDLADAILFDPDGVHRGGMVQAGERRVVGVLLAEA